MNKSVLFIVLCCFYLGSNAQLDTTDYAIEDSLYFEDRPNYLGFNISPLVGGIIGGYNKDIKFTLVYKRNIGYKNLRLSVNHHRTANRLPYDSYEVVSTTDSSYDAQFYADNYKSIDLRFGLEELRGYRSARLHIGADIILGYAAYKEEYYTERLMLDSGGTYRHAEDNIVLNSGFNSGDYFNIGVDVSFGFDWFISDDFLFTFQMTPQFNYNIKLNSVTNDDIDVLAEPNNFVDFKLTYFDVLLIYKF